MSYLTTQDVRLFILDRAASDNVLDMDLSFGEDEIKTAMDMARMAFNEIPPFILCYNESSRIPKRMFMLHGITKYLYLSAVSRLQRNRVEYQAGNMVADPDAHRIKFFTEQIQYHDAEFKSGAKQYKVEINLNAAYGSY